MAFVASKAVQDWDPIRRRIGQKAGGSSGSASDAMSTFLSGLGGGSSSTTSNAPEGGYVDANGEWHAGSPPSSGSGGTSGGTPGSSENAAQYNPDAEYVLGELKKRYEGDMGAGRAADLAASKIRENSIGIGKEMAAGRARRGVSGTSIDSYDANKLARSEQQQIAGAVADIGQAAEARRDALLATTASVGQGKAATALADRQLAQNAWLAEQENARAQQSAQLGRLQAILQLMGMATSASGL